MKSMENKSVLVVGLGLSGMAAGRLLIRIGAKVTVVDGADTLFLQNQARQLQSEGIVVRLGVKNIPSERFDLAVLSPGIAHTSPLVVDLVQNQIPLTGELELGFQHTRCPCVAITGTNGKTTTTELVERILKNAGLKTVAAGNIGLPLCDVAAQTSELDFVTLEVSSFQLETVERFRPVAGVLLNLTPDHLDRYNSQSDYIRAKARLFEKQNSDDRAIIQYESLQQLTGLGVALPGRVITFSARHPDANLTLHGSLVTARGTDWDGPLLDVQKTRLRGPHNTENMMAALAAALTVGVPLDKAVEALSAYAPAPHRCELVAQIGGVSFINDSKATNVDAVRQALLTIPSSEDRRRNIFLIAGGKDKGFDYDELGPLLESRTAGVFLLGETRDKIFQAWSRFTPCMRVDSLLEAVNKAASAATVGDVVLLSPACSSFDMFQNYQHRGELFRQAVLQLPALSGERGVPVARSNSEGKCQKEFFELAERGGKQPASRE